MELYADATGCTVVEPRPRTQRCSGMAMVAATAAGLYPSLDAACLAMQQGGRERAPDPAARQQFDKDYRIFLEMLRQRQVIDAMSSDMRRPALPSGALDKHLLSSLPGSQNSWPEASDLNACRSKPPSII